MKKIIAWFRANFSWGEQPLEIVEEQEPKVQSSVIPEERKSDFDEKKGDEKDEEDINKTEESEKIEKGDDDEKDDIETPTEAEPLNVGSAIGKDTKDFVAIEVGDLSDEQVDELRESFKDGSTHETMCKIDEELKEQSLIIIPDNLSEEEVEEFRKACSPQGLGVSDKGQKDSSEPF